MGQQHQGIFTHDKGFVANRALLALGKDLQSIPVMRRGQRLEFEPPPALVGHLPRGPDVLGAFAQPLHEEASDQVVDGEARKDKLVLELALVLQLELEETCGVVGHLGLEPAVLVLGEELGGSLEVFDAFLGVLRCQMSNHGTCIRLTELLPPSSISRQAFSVRRSSW